ncbi:hypothetical protein BDV96DRAFT_642387 [Lophiotrema nucula]|uniref:DUF1168 domain protein n=1 Tax=Lophiotrema nucula TaxID=690887 RepID=A0A6A5ZLN7_9PLEO|nr:hypothetical protein BDV96DRAFT_642387 [Lophiotrema nucula]
MSEPIPEAIPTSADPRSKRPTKKRALTPRSQFAGEVDALFAKPDREIHIPTSAPGKGLAPPPEIVANVQGSSAGAGSGEFHVYKASRRREYERLRLMDEEVKKEEDEKAFKERKEEQERKDREKTEKNKAKRLKKRAAQEAKKKGKNSDGAGSKAGSKFRKLPPSAASPNSQDENDSEVLDGGEVKNAAEVGLTIHDDD